MQHTERTKRALTVLNYLTVMAIILMPFFINPTKSGGQIKFIFDLVLGMVGMVATVVFGIFLLRTNLSVRDYLTSRDLLSSFVLTVVAMLGLHLTMYATMTPSLGYYLCGAAAGVFLYLRVQYNKSDDDGRK